MAIKLRGVPSGSVKQFAIEHGHRNIMSFPIQNGDINRSYVTLPDGKPPFSYAFPMVSP